ncbi:MAG TPA: GDSL-type esterase/lipase family protein [Solirubrobacteraceae bacterium]|nr:GDSL-type esterase/lipase family protein [Solirubrobacteraceae bacterium]
MTTRGLVALGDSITNGHGEPALGVHPQSWAQWLAEALELPFTKLAADGALAADVLREQVPRLRGPYDVACVYAGVNDVRVRDFDAGAYERDLHAIAASVAEASARVALCTIPLDLGRPRAAPKPRAAGAVVRRVAREVGAVVVDLDDLAGPPWLLPDAVHPTALGQLEIADRAARALGAARVPSSRVEIHRSRRARARFAGRLGVMLVGDLRRRAVERVRMPSA